MAKRPSTFKFRRTDRIGAAGAEEDDEYLASCFVDTGDLDIVANISDNRFVVLGRTGTGKTALIQQLIRTRGDRVIDVRPHNLALTYITNSTILNFFASIGVNLDPFFTLLWRHVFTVEILNRHFERHVSHNSKTILEWLRGLFTGTSKQDREMAQAVRYLEDWGRTFWQETEFRVKEITKKVETDLNNQLIASLGITNANISVGTQTVDKLSEAQRTELLSRGQDIVSKAQVRDLHQVMKLLDTVLEDRQKQYYVVVDSLDENWVEEQQRYKLIMALILTARDFIKVKNAKIILALRRDLIERVFRLVRPSGFQEEKYQSLYLPLAWSRSDILDVLDRRVRHLVSRRYTKSHVSYKDLLPREFNGTNIGDYIYSIAKRPREVIAFFNTCILAATDERRLTAKQLAIAEGEYSRSRLRALADEWSADYPFLLGFTRVLVRRPSSFKLSTVSDSDIEELCLDIVAENPDGEGILYEHARTVVDSIWTAQEFKFTMFQIFYRIGLVGLKIARHEGASWVDDLGQAVSRNQLTDETSVVVNAAYVRALGVTDRVHKGR